MQPLEILITAVALSLDAFAVSVAGGVVIQERKLRHAFRTALFLGGFQAVAPVLGWLAAHGFRGVVAGYDHWVAFTLLTLVGAKMIYEATKLEPVERQAQVFGLPTLLVLSVATSLDAFAVGIVLSSLHVPILAPIIVIGLVTFVASLIGTRVGDRFGHLFESRIEIIGGLVLIGIGLKILIEHLFLGKGG
jgi:putative Mn2+ efflux pump MntP